MKIECVREKLQGAISLSERMTGKNLNMQILSGLHLSTGDNVLKIRSTNLDIGIEIEIPVKVIKKGEAVIPSSVLNSYISGIYADKTITLDEDNGNLKIEGNKNNAVIKTYPKEDYPAIPRITEGSSFKINAKELVLGFKSVWFAASVSSIKPELSSVYVYKDQNEIVFVSTDSFRLAEKRFKAKDIEGDLNLLIPFKNVPEIIKVFDNGNEDISVTFDKNQITFEKEGVYLVSRLINGSFPDYKQIIPKSSTSEVVVLKQDLVNALKVSTIFTDKFNQANITLSSKNKTVTIVTKNSDVGENKSTISASIEGEDYTSNFNQKYLSDVFQSIYADSVYLSFNGPQRPVIIRGNGDVSFLYLVMPMNR
jgi:DNA polymerase-3 subunit beta